MPALLDEVEVRRPEETENSLDVRMEGVCGLPHNRKKDGTEWCNGTCDLEKLHYPQKCHCSDCGESF